MEKSPAVFDILLERNCVSGRWIVEVGWPESLPVPASVAEVADALKTRWRSSCRGSESETESETGTEIETGPGNRLVTEWVLSELEHHRDPKDRCTSAWWCIRWHRWPSTCTFCKDCPASAWWLHRTEWLPSRKEPGGVRKVPSGPEWPQYRPNCDTRHWAGSGRHPTVPCTSAWSCNRRRRWLSTCTSCRRIQFLGWRWRRWEWVRSNWSEQRNRPNRKPRYRQHQIRCSGCWNWTIWCNCSTAADRHWDRHWHQPGSCWSPRNAGATATASARNRRLSPANGSPGTTFFCWNWNRPELWVGPRSLGSWGCRGYHWWLPVGAGSSYSAAAGPAVLASLLAHRIDCRPARIRIRLHSIKLHWIISSVKALSWASCTSHVCKLNPGNVCRWIGWQDS